MPSRIARLLKPQRVVWLAMTSSVLVLGVVLHVVLSGQGPDAVPRDLPLIILILPFLMTPVLLVAIGVVRRTYIGPGLGLWTVREDLLPPLQGSDDPLKAARSAIARANTGFLLSIALTEAIALFGFISSFISRDPSRFYPAAAIALVLMAVQFPRPIGLLARLGKRELQALSNETS
ncbi:MAG: hypothetical protein EA397_15745 [Deltaproteobacteria bacterium]|nr:MAG: hypothetical protein EA397_15745 [Deltaproteobacteria bacterium]